MLNNLIKRGLKASRDTWFSRAMHLFDRSSVDESVWLDLEELLVSADVGMNTTEKLIDRVKQKINKDGIADGSSIRNVLKAEMINMLKVDSAEPVDPLPVPHVTMTIGVNGGGKTTSIGKLARISKAGGKQVLLVAADTFRVAAIDQLKKVAEMIGVDVIAHQPGADPGAVVYDALEAARSRHVDEVIIDTAGRLHTKYNLMEELKKIKRVATKIDNTAPHEVILVIDATTGQNGLSQARHFTEAIGVTGILLSKLDGTAKGGIVLAICDELNIPIRYIGLGDDLDAIAPFDAETFVDALCS